MLGLDLLATLSREGHKPAVLYSGDNLPLSSGMHVCFEISGMESVEVIRNDGCDTVLIWDDGDAELVRYADEPTIEQSPPRYGLAAPHIKE